MTPRQSPKNSLNSDDRHLIGRTAWFSSLGAAVSGTVAWVLGLYGILMPPEVAAGLGLICTALIQTGVYYFSGKRR